MFAFFPHDVADLKFSISADGRNYQEVKADKNEYFQGAGDYDYWKPVLYHADNIGGAGKFLRIEMTGETQIGRVEIMHELGKNQAGAPSMNANDLKDFSSAASDQLFGHILPFWCGPAVDHEQGGWMGWLSNDLKPDRSKPKGLIVNCRILWTFSAVHRARPEKIFQQMADRAFDYLMNRFWDARCGGAFWQLNDAGRCWTIPRKFTARRFSFMRWRNITGPSARPPPWPGRWRCSSWWKSTRTIPRMAVTWKCGGATGPRPALTRG